MDLKVSKKRLQWVFASVFVGLLICFMYSLTFETNVFRSFVRACTRLGVNNVNGQLVLFLGLTMACLDGWVLLCLTLFKRVKTSPTIHHALFLGNVVVMITSGLPLFWEANTDSSFAMFALFSKTPIFWIYAVTLGLMLGLGLVMSIAHVHQRGVLFAQALLLIASDVPMFFIGYLGLPIGVLTNVCVNIFFAGLGIKFHQGYGNQIQIWMETRFLKRFTPSQSIDPIPALFGFLASSRLLSWAVASVYGPTNWCACIEPMFALAVFSVLISVWLYACYRLLIAVLNPTVDKKFVPFEPILVYNRLVRPYMVVFGTHVNLQKIVWYRKSMRFCKPIFRHSYVWFHFVPKVLIQRLSLLGAVLWCRMPSQLELHTSAWLSDRDKHTVILYASKIPLSQTTSAQVWKLLGGVTSLSAVFGLGVLGMHNVEVQQRIETTQAEVDLIEDKGKLASNHVKTNEQPMYDKIMRYNVDSSGVLNQNKNASFLDATKSKHRFSIMDAKQGALLTEIRRVEGFENIARPGQAIELIAKRGQ